MISFLLTVVGWLLATIFLVTTVVLYFMFISALKEWKRWQKEALEIKNKYQRLTKIYAPKE